MEPERERLNAAMNESRLDLRLRWTEVARRAGVDSSTLRRIRYGEGAVSDLTARGLEVALEWPHGTIAAILDGLSPGLAERAVPRELDSRAREIVRATFEEWRKEYGERRARKMINEVLADLPESNTDDVEEDERGAG